MELRLKAQVTALEGGDPLIDFVHDKLAENVLKEFWRKARIRHLNATYRRDEVEVPFNYWFDVNEDDIKDWCLKVINLADEYIRTHGIKGDVYEYEVTESDYEHTGVLCDVGAYSVSGNTVVYAEFRVVEEELRGDYSKVALKVDAVKVVLDPIPGDKDVLERVVLKLAESGPGSYDVLVRNGKVYVMPTT